MLHDIVPKRCAGGPLSLPDAIRQLAAAAPEPVRPPLHVLAASLDCRTALRPASTTVPAVQAALELLLGHMIDQQTFVGRHEPALRYLQQMSSVGT